MGLGLNYKNEISVLEEKVVNGVPILTYPLLDKTNIIQQGFSTKLGGVSTGDCATMNISTTRGDKEEAITENRKRLAAAVGVLPEDMVYTGQTHTTNVKVVTEADKGTCLKETDGMVTNVKGVCLVTFYADCVPLYFVDPVKKTIGLSHSGWRGTVHKMANVTIQKMTETFGTNPNDVVAAIGPSICQDCYEVSKDVIEHIREQYEPSDHAQLFYKKENGKYQLNLWQANKKNLLEAGVLESHIAVTNLCTCCNPERLFSHRATNGKRGNLSAFLALKKEGGR